MVRRRAALWVEEDRRLGSQDLALTEGLSPPEKGPVRVAIESRSDSIQGFTYDGLAAQSMRISSRIEEPIMNASHIRVLTIDDHPLIREGIGAINSQPDMSLVVSASNGKEGMDMLRALRPDVTLLDLQLSDLSGIEIIIWIRTEVPDPFHHFDDPSARYPIQRASKREPAGTF